MKNVLDLWHTFSMIPVFFPLTVCLLLCFVGGKVRAFPENKAEVRIETSLRARRCVHGGLDWLGNDHSQFVDVIPLINRAVSHGLGGIS